MNHATHLTYSAPSKDWSFSTKAKYARLRTPRGLRTSFRKSFPFRPRMRPQAKVSPLERTRRARPSRWPVADVGARQPLQRAFTALAVRRKEHPLSDGNLREVYHNWRRRAIRLSCNSPRRSTLIPIFSGQLIPISRPTPINAGRKVFSAPAESALDFLRAGPKPRKRLGFRAIPRQGARLRRRESGRSTRSAWRLFFKVGARSTRTPVTRRRTAAR